jgi:ribosomal protein S12 methylthiotransferase
MKINIITLGCSKNTVDSEKLAGSLKAEGHNVFFDRNKNDCDTVIVNTCGFIGDAKEESINVILEQIEAKKRRHNRTRLIVAGCLVQRYEKELKKEMPEVDEWHGTHFFSLSETRRSLSTPSHYAYLKIAEGCNRSCSYCAIPFIRGAHHSRPIDDIVEEAKKLITSGVKELIVISQDTTYYGLDIYHRRALGELLERLATESGAPWIRLHYTYPTSFPLDAIDVIRRHDNICNYIDIPLQHINTRILNSMKRGIDRDGTLQLLEHFRRELPDVAVRTTLIVGYPGETEAEFEELKEFVRTARFDRMGCFAYSPEEGTAAFSLHDDIPQEVKERRVAELMDLQEQISFEKNQSRVGNTYNVLIDREEGDYLIGRTQYDSPEVDDEVLIPTDTLQHSRIHTLFPGTFVNVRITSAQPHDLFGEIA